MGLFSDETPPLVGGYWDQEDVPLGRVTRSVYSKGRVIEPELIDEICDTIMRGSTPKVAACQFLTESEHHTLLRESSEYQHRILQACAKARALAESAVFVSDPGKWLLRGPGGRMIDQDLTWQQTIKTEQLIKTEQSVDLSKLSEDDLRKLLELTERATEVRDDLTPD